MTTYKFHCLDCKSEYAVRQSIHSELPIVCTKCGSNNIKQSLPQITTRTCTGLAAIERCEGLARDDMKKLLKGDDSTLSDLVGDKINPLKQ
jgi:putative FmdB family regulatory protein